MKVFLNSEKANTTRRRREIVDYPYTGRIGPLFSCKTLFSRADNEELSRPTIIAQLVALMEGNPLSWVQVCNHFADSAPRHRPTKKQYNEAVKKCGN